MDEVSGTEWVPAGVWDTEEEWALEGRSAGEALGEAGAEWDTAGVTAIPTQWFPSLCLRGYALGYEPPAESLDDEERFLKDEAGIHKRTTSGDRGRPEAKQER